jgi:hypothetical protein
VRQPDIAIGWISERDSAMVQRRNDVMVVNASEVRPSLVWSVTLRNADSLRPVAKMWHHRLAGHLKSTANSCSDST